MVNNSAATATDKAQEDSNAKWVPLILGTSGAFVGMVILGLLIWYCCKAKRVDEMKEAAEVITFNNAALDIMPDETV